MIDVAVVLRVTQVCRPHAVCKCGAHCLPAPDPRSPGHAGALALSQEGFLSCRTPGCCLHSDSHVHVSL